MATCGRALREEKKKVHPVSQRSIGSQKSPHGPQGRPGVTEWPTVWRRQDPRCVVGRAGWWTTVIDTVPVKEIEGLRGVSITTICGDDGLVRAPLERRSWGCFGDPAGDARGRASARAGADVVGSVAAVVLTNVPGGAMAHPSAAR